MTTTEGWTREQMAAHLALHGWELVQLPTAGGMGAYSATTHCMAYAFRDVAQKVHAIVEHGWPPHGRIPVHATVDHAALAQIVRAIDDWEEGGDGAI